MSDAPAHIPFKKRFSYEKRVIESQRVMKKYVGRYPFIIERSPRARDNIPNTIKYKYLVPGDMTMSHLIYTVRRSMSIAPEIALFIFCGDILFPSSMSIKQIYTEYKDTDGFVYLQYLGESTFGQEI